MKALSHFYKPACEIGLSHISKPAYEKGLETPVRKGLTKYGGFIFILQGDTGSPLICKRADGKWVAVGVTSVGRQCSGTPTVFEKVSSELNYVFSRLDT